MEVNKSIANPHDATFKKLFGKREIAKDLIETNLPTAILKELDLNTLERQDGSFVTEKMEENFSDLIYRVKLLNKRDVYISFLFEHKSYKDKLSIFQVTRYIIGLWSRAMETGEKELPVVIPIVVYHGEGQWNYKIDLRELIPDYDRLPDYLKKRLPVMKHDLISITDHNEEKLLEYNPVTRMIVRAFKYIFEDKDRIIEEFLLSVEEIGEDVPDEEIYPLIEIILVYYSIVNKELTEEDIIRKIRELEGKGERIMTILEQRELKGIEKGMELGRYEERKYLVKSMLLDGEPLEKIIKYTRLELKEIEKIKEELKH